MTGIRQNGDLTRMMGEQSKAGRQRIRMEIAAERLLEGPMRRRRWAAADRDKIAEFLFSLVSEETKLLKGE